jgi:hemoglobin
MMTLVRRSILIAPLVLLLAAGGTAAQEKSLYLRLGGYDIIAAILDDFGMRLGADQQFSRFFAGHSQSSQMRQRQLVLDLVCQMTGGPCFYIGRDLKTAHAGLAVSKADWTRAMKLFDDTLVKFRVGDRERGDLAGLLAPLEKDIVEK